MRYVDPDGRDIRDYIRWEKSAIRCGYLVGGIPGAIAGYKFAKWLEDYNGPQRDAANNAVIGSNPTNPANNGNFKKLPDSESAFHQLDDGAKVSKYIAIVPDEIYHGTAEIVWNDTENELVTDSKARGTYNYGYNKFEHAIKDVIPWIILGTGIDDSSTMGERIWDTIKATPDFFRNLFSKAEEEK